MSRIHSSSYFGGNFGTVNARTLKQIVISVRLFSVFFVRFSRPMNLTRRNAVTESKMTVTLIRERGNVVTNRRRTNCLLSRRQSVDLRKMSRVQVFSVVSARTRNAKNVNRISFFVRHIFGITTLCLSPARPPKYRIKSSVISAPTFRSHYSTS